MFGLFKKKKSGPFMEHPGEFNSALEAMEEVVRRLRKLSDWRDWITFGAQGEGSGLDQYEFAEIRMLRDKLDVGDKPLDLPRIMEVAKVKTTSLVADGPHYSVATASPGEVARILDAIFRQHFGLRPFADEGDDYAVGAEW